MNDVDRGKLAEAMKEVRKCNCDEFCTAKTKDLIFRKLGGVKNGFYITEDYFYQTLAKQKEEFKKSLLSDTEISNMVRGVFHDSSAEKKLMPAEIVIISALIATKLVGKIKKVEGVEEKIKDLIAHEIFYCAYYALKGTDKRDTDKLSEAITKALTKP